jgi:hypothetical protein
MKPGDIFNRRTANGWSKWILTDILTIEGVVILGFDARKKNGKRDPNHTLAVSPATDYCHDPESGEYFEKERIETKRKYPWEK